ncbi:SOS response-associated peptidase [Kordiimonas marina]|uniref:SOS response-associated peptidase n=1 Tax=Kordiimonas marina TaxID=2872312 RepID=UPI001FF10C1E|nr:SOS response-associated peptidase [Kordiimonas marina]MCJ9427586.1 SOS response-associated peptidase [Kordiimonas marina]
MCGRYVLISPAEEISGKLGVEARHPVPPSYNIAPRQPVLIIRRAETGGKELAAVEWGLIPEWAKEIGAKPLINARVETVQVKPSFRSSLIRKRCLVPADGWYEWRTEGGRKQPYYVTPVGGGPMAFAGTWATWHGPAGDHWLETMAIITGPATGPMRSLHSRKPLVLRPEQYDAWLAPHDPLPRGFLESFDWMPETAFHWHPVTPRMGNIQYNEPGCLDAPEDDPQPTLF